MASSESILSARLKQLYQDIEKDGDHNSVVSTYLPLYKHLFAQAKQTWPDLEIGQGPHDNDNLRALRALTGQLMAFVQGKLSI